ncbi:MAG TPA: hypothetical protein VJ836_04555 [Candidatus Saccharimonadales bacterium]|nr:hypothetical protein [Candidatus Saccharimonadales bacterium]
MNSKPIETNPDQATKSSAELVLNNDEIEQLAKFLDALLESDLASKGDGGNGND